MADETTMNLQSKVIASFDDPDAMQWIVQGSKFATKDFPQAQTVRTWPDSLYGRDPEQKNLLALGIHGRFDRKGYNYIEIIPAKKGSDGKLAPTPSHAPGPGQVPRPVGVGSELQLHHGRAPAGLRGRRQGSAPGLADVRRLERT